MEVAIPTLINKTVRMHITSFARLAQIREALSNITHGRWRSSGNVYTDQLGASLVTAAFAREGIAAWIERRATCWSPASATPDRTVRPPLLSEGLHAEIVRVRAALQMTGSDFLVCLDTHGFISSLPFKAMLASVSESRATLRACASPREIIWFQTRGYWFVRNSGTGYSIPDIRKIDT